ncbi:MAG: 1-acyl-sn-glycerol-3-phosphate acyltransferase [Anaerolineae bacterium]|nr:1-acyl-sn-glycerol-3-phosphate acyltransferase [Anaerolineae bacterium]
MRAVIRIILFKMLARVTVIGEENVPETSPSILMINHISLLDPILGMGAVTKRYVIPMSKLENKKNPLIRPWIWWWDSYYVNRGNVDRQALQSSIELLKTGQLLLISPEGTRHSEGLQQPKDGLAYYATKADALIVPTAITGTQNWVKQMFTLRRPKMQIIFGKPFRLKTEGRARIPRDELAAMTEEAMYQLATAIPDEYADLRGVYRDLSKATTDTIEFVIPE